MKSKKKPKPADDFVSVAKRLECDEDKDRFEAKLGKLAKTKPCEIMTGAFRAKLHVVPTAEGGRKTPFRNGYRPQFHISASPYCTSFLISEIEGADEIAPGEMGTVVASLLAAEGLEAPVGAGTEFSLREGNRVIAQGVILEYL